MQLRNGQNEEMHLARYEAGMDSAWLSCRLQTLHPPSNLMSSPAQELSKLCCLEVFVELSLRRLN